MKKIILIIITIIFIILGISLFSEPVKSKFFNSKENLSFDDFEWFDLVVESVCFLYYEVPKDLETIIQVAEKCMERNPEYFSGYPGSVEGVRDSTLPNLKRYKNRINLTFDEYSVTLDIGNNEANFSLLFLLPCTSEFDIGKHPVEYYLFLEKFESGRYFDKDNFPFVGPEYIKMNQDFLSEKKKLDNEIKSYSYKTYVFEENEIPIQTFLEYKQGDQLYQFCEKQPLKSSLSYYQKLEELAEKICQKYNLSRFIFMCLDYKE